MKFLPKLIIENQKFLRLRGFAHKYRFLLIVAALLLLFENGLLAFDNFQTKTPILGMKLDNQNVSFVNVARLKGLVDQKFESLADLKFSYDNQIFEVKKQDVGAKVDSNLLAAKVLSMGRQGNIISKIIFQNAALLGLKSQELAGDVSESQVALLALDLSNKFNREATPPTPDFKNDPNKVIGAADGQKLNSSAFTMIVEKNIFNPPANPIPLPVEKTFTANHADEEAEGIAKVSQSLITKPISITSGGLTFTLTAEDLRQMLTVSERPDPKNPKKITLALRLDDVKLNQKLGDFATKVEALTHAEFDDHDARVAIYSQFYSGKRKNIQIPTGRNLAYQGVLGEKDTGGEKFVYLTFDDGPNTIYHPLILETLKAKNVQATFFLVGNNTQKSQDVAQKTKADGHVIGNHSLTHSFLPNLSQKAILTELSSTDDILNQVNGTPITLFRPPYGGVNAYVKKSADSLGLKLNLWDVDPKDWSEPPEEELVRRVVTAAHSGADILLHSNHLVTAKALPKIIDTLRSQGYSFKTLD